MLGTSGRLLPFVALFLAAASACGAVEPVPVLATEGEIRRRAVAVAGVRYRDGGRDRRRGFDAVGLVRHLYQGMGLEPPAGGFATAGQPVALDRLEPWDLVALASESSDRLGVFLGMNDLVTVSPETKRVTIVRLDEPPWSGGAVTGRRLLAPAAAPDRSAESSRQSGVLADRSSSRPSTLNRRPSTRPSADQPSPESYRATVAWQHRPAVEPAEPEPAAGARSEATVLGRGVEVGLASYYGGSRDRHAGPRTSSGERMNTRAFTAAHRTHPFGTLVRVTNLSNGHTVIVRINDRGPHRRGRIIDVTRAAAEKLGFLSKGLTRVRVEVLRKRTARTR